MRQIKKGENELWIFLYNTIGRRSVYHCTNARYGSIYGHNGFWCDFDYDWCSVAFDLRKNVRNPSWKDERSARGRGGNHRAAVKLYRRLANYDSIERSLLYGGISGPV